MVTFDPMVEDLRLGRPAFGEAFLAAHGIDAVHILSGRNDWYQDEDLPAVLAAVRAATARFGRVVAYGSSMGGYAALRFGARAGATEVVAISPQFSVIDGRAAFERRWPHMRAATRWLHEAPGDALPAYRAVTVLFDPHDIDGAHAPLIAAAVPGTRLVALPFAGHPAGTFLAETGLVGRTVLEAVGGDLDVAALREAARRGRSGSGQYLFTLARHQPLGRLRVKQALAERAVATRPDEPVYLSYAALVAEACGDPARAAQHHGAACATDRFGLAHIRHARFLWRCGRPAEARAAAAAAAAALPGNLVPAHMTALMMAFAGEAAAALAIAARTRVPGKPGIVTRLLPLENAALRWPRAARPLGRIAAAWLARRTDILPASVLTDLRQADGD